MHRGTSQQRVYQAVCILHRCKQNRIMHVLAAIARFHRMGELFAQHSLRTVGHERSC